MVPLFVGKVLVEKKFIVIGSPNATLVLFREIVYAA